MIRYLLAILSIFFIISTADVVTPVVIFGGSNPLSLQRTSEEKIFPSTLSTSDYQQLLHNTYSPKVILVWQQSGLTPHLASKLLGAYSKLNESTSSSSSSLEISQLNISNSFSQFIPFSTFSSNDKISSFYRNQFFPASTSTFTVTDTINCQDVANFVRNSLSSSETRRYIQISSPDINGLQILNHCLGTLYETFNDELSYEDYLIILQGQNNLFSTNEHHLSSTPSTQIQLSNDDSNPSDSNNNNDSDNSNNNNDNGNGNGDGDDDNDDNSSGIPPVFPDNTDLPTPMQQITSIKGKYITSGTLTVIGFSILLISFTLFGFLQMLDVEGPMRYPYASHLPAATREY